MFEALTASCCCCPSVVMMGFNSFFRFLFAFPLEAFATCFAFWIAACLMCEPFIVWRGGFVLVLVGWRGGRSSSVSAVGAWELLVVLVVLAAFFCFV